MILLRQSIKEALDVHDVPCMGTYTTESINYQKNTEFGDEVTECLATLMGTNAKTKDLVATGIAEVVKKHTNLTIKFEIDTGVLNAAVRIPDLVTSNPLMYDWIKEHFSSIPARKKIREKGFASVGVDLAKGRVYGDLASIEHNIYLGNVFFRESLEFTPGEIASIVLHEVGHLMSQYEMIFRLTRTNFILQEYSEEIANQRDPARRAVIVKEVERVTGYPLKGKEFLDEAHSKEAVATILLNSEVAANYEELGVDFYSMRGTEALADQYVSRLGYHVELASGMVRLNKLYDSWGAPTTMSLIMSIVSLIAVTVMTFGIFLLLILCLGGRAQIETVYDDDVRRIEVIRKDVLRRLKQETDPVRKRSLIRDIDTIDNLLKGAGDQINIIGRIFAVIGPTSRSGYRGVRLQKALEDLSASELNLAAERLLS